MNLAWLTRGAASAERARRQMERRGVTPNGYPLWKPPEVATVLDYHPSYQVIFALLNRTKPAIYSKASRLGVAKRRTPPLSDNEILRLRKIYPTGTRTEIEAAFPGRTYAAIVRAANSRKIYRAKKPPLLTGNRLLDQVLARAQRDGYTMMDLDGFARSKRYFRQRRWRSKPNEVAHCLAARAMGGVLRASFKASS